MTERDWRATGSLVAAVGTLLIAGAIGLGMFFSDKPSDVRAELSKLLQVKPADVLKEVGELRHEIREVKDEVASVKAELSELKRGNE